MISVIADNKSASTKLKYQIILLFLILTIYPSKSISSPSDSIIDNIQEMLRNRIEHQPIEVGYIEVMGAPLYSQTILPTFYTETNFEPLWVGQDLSGIRSALTAIHKAFDHGLNPEAYHLSNIVRLLPDPKNVRSIRNLSLREQVDIELLITDAILLLASHHISGQFNPETLDPNWKITREEVNFNDVLRRIKNGQHADILIEGLAPSNREYSYLKEALARYRELSKQGGWPEIPDGKVLKPGEDSERVPFLRKRLQQAGDFGGINLDSTMYDDELKQAVIRFQARHGLDQDGVIGPRSMAALNNPVEMRIEQTMINMERWCWLKRDLGSNHIRVNIANFLVEVFENDHVVKEFRAIVGRNYRQTPSFSARMTYLVLSPYWHIPPGIAVNDILPGLRANPNYTREKNMKIFDGWGSDAKEIDPLSVNWNGITRSNLRYRFRQDPGPTNSLGDVKFMFPNSYHVYLHDTPARNLFTRTVRDFSSGCIRVQNPLDLAEYLLRRNRGWDMAAIRKSISEQKERTVSLAEPIWVHIFYWTAWSTDTGEIHFRDDIYQRDLLLLKAIRENNIPITSL